MSTEFMKMIKSQSMHFVEQNNASVKGDGGTVGLSETQKLGIAMMVSGPEMTCCHLEQKKHAQLAFA